MSKEYVLFRSPQATLRLFNLLINGGTFPKYYCIIAPLLSDLFMSAQSLGFYSAPEIDQHSSEFPRWLQARREAVLGNHNPPVPLHQTHVPAAAAAPSH